MISGVSRTFEELEVEAVYRSRLGRTVLEADNLWFSALSHNTNPIHLDAELAARTEGTPAREQRVHARARPRSERARHER